MIFSSINVSFSAGPQRETLSEGTKTKYFFRKLDEEQKKIFTWIWPKHRTQRIATYCMPMLLLGCG